MKILVLSAAYKSYATKSIVKAGEEKGHEMIVKDPSYLYLLISDRVQGYDKVFDGFGQTDKPVRLKANEYDAIIPRIGRNLSYGCAVLEHLNNNLSIFSTQSSVGIKTAADKLISAQKISQAKIRVPLTVIGDKVNHPSWVIDQVGGLPAISKELEGSQGNGVYPLESIYQTNVFLSNFTKTDKKLLIQGFIDAGGKDYRAIVIDGKVIVSMERSSKKGELRANLSQGGSGRKVELSKEDEQMCINAAKACSLETAGVDLLKDKEGKSYIIEINGNYGYKVEKITKVDISTPLIEYCERNHKDGDKANKETTAKFYGLFTNQQITGKTTANNDSYLVSRNKNLTEDNYLLKKEVDGLKQKILIQGIKDVLKK
jgi:ribosomal protein S6--L-glutamate ligase